MTNVLKEGKVIDYSKRTIQKVIKELNNYKKNNPGPISVLECGCGGGNATGQILKSLGKEDSITCVELETHLAKQVKETFKNDQRVTVHQADMATFASDQKFDFVLNMIPSNSYIVQLDKLWDNLISMCKPGAIIVTLPYYGNPMQLLDKLPIDSVGMKRWKHYKSILKKYSHSNKSSIANFPPCKIIVLEKNDK